MRSCQIHRLRSDRVVVVLLSVLLCSTSAVAETLPAAIPETAANPPPTLLTCRQIALGNQPSVAAAQASLAAAIDRAKAVENMHSSRLLAPDLPIRRKQAPLGVTIASAGLAQAETDALYSVTYSYLAAVYARQQIDAAKQIEDNLHDLDKLVNDAFESPKGEQAKLKSGSKVAVREHKKVIDSYLETLNGRSQEAKQGEERALAALREAMGVGCEYPLSPLPRDLPCPQDSPNKDALIAAALAQRGELIQALNVVEVVCLEVEAQGASCRSLVRTFAAGSDLHARPVPSGVYDGREYRPAALAPEMPTTLAGSRAERQAQARDYQQRAEAVAAKTRNLIVLSVEDVYHRWKEKAEAAVQLKKAYEHHWEFSHKLLEEMRFAIVGEKGGQAAPAYPNMDDLIHANLLTTRLYLDWKDAHYQSLQALAALEQATGGGFRIDWDAAPPCPPSKHPIRQP